MNGMLDEAAKSALNILRSLLSLAAVEPTLRVGNCAQPGSGYANPSQNVTAQAKQGEVVAY